MSDQRRFRDYGTRHKRIAAKLFGLLQGIGVAIAWPHGAYAGDATCRGAGSRQHIFCQTLNKSILLNPSDGTTVQARQTPEANLRVAQTDRRYQMIASGFVPSSTVISASSCTGSGFTASGTSGSVTVTPSQTTTYGISCSGATGSTTVAVGATPALPPAPSGSTVVSQIHNAPGWLPNHAYASATGPFTRVNSGPGWHPANGTWNPGQALNAYQLTSGSCTSGTTMLTGTGSSIQDGTCTWKYLSATDYVSIAGWSNDNKPWASGTAYGYHDVVTSDSPLRAYMQIADSCVSAIPPTGKGTTYSLDGEGYALGVGSDGCQWVYVTDVLYSSKRSYIPTQTYNRAKNTATIHLLPNYVGLLWNDRQFVAGQNGEQSPIQIRNHDSYYGEGPNLTCEVSKCGHLIIAAAPGEGFADTLKSTDPLKGFDPTKGVSILDNDGYRWPVQPDGLFVENFVDIIGLQIKSLHGSAVGDFKEGNNNDDTIRNSILEGGHTDAWTTPAVVSLDTGSAVVNSLIISHANQGIVFKYPGFVLHDTIVNAEGTGDVGIETGNRWVFRDTAVADTAIFGFAHAGAAGNNQTAFDPTSSNNVTDAPSGDSGTTTWMGSTPPNAPIVIIPGTTYGSSLIAAFMNPGSDYRPKRGGPLTGRGGAYGRFALYCPQGAANGYGANLTCPARVDYNFDTPDIIGTARPQGGSYDIGAWQTPH